ncbi:MAG: alpha-L-fucosidase [Bacteroidota bacterium]
MPASACSFTGGAYSVPAGVYNGKEIKGLGEWIMEDAKIPIPEYEQFAEQFDPQKFDAKAWVRMAKDAGVKYIVITSKHHDGLLSLGFESHQLRYRRQLTIQEGHT